YNVKLTGAFEIAKTSLTKLPITPARSKLQQPASLNSPFLCKGDATPICLQTCCLVKSSMNLLNIFYPDNQRASFRHHRVFFTSTCLLLAALTHSPQPAFAQHPQPAQQTTSQNSDQPSETSQVPGAKTFDNVTIERVRPDNL